MKNIQNAAHILFNLAREIKKKVLCFVVRLQAEELPGRLLKKSFGSTAFTTT